MTVPHGLPTTRHHLLDPPEELGPLRPVSPMIYPDGHEGWLVTGYTAARAVLADQRFSSRQELKHSPIPLATASNCPGWRCGSPSPRCCTGFRRCASPSPRRRSRSAPVRSSMEWTNYQ